MPCVKSHYKESDNQPSQIRYEIYISAFIFFVTGDKWANGSLNVNIYLLNNLS